MTDRRNFSMDDEAADLLDQHPDDNHSEIVRELLKEYYAAGSRSTTEAAVRVRRRELKRQLHDIEAEEESIRAELDRLDALDSDDTETDLGQRIAAVEIYDPSKATVDNDLVQKLAAEYDVPEQAVAERLEEQARKNQLENLSSVNAD